MPIIKGNFLQEIQIKALRWVPQVICRVLCKFEFWNPWNAFLKQNVISVSSYFILEKLKFSEPLWCCLSWDYHQDLSFSDRHSNGYNNHRTKVIAAEVSSPSPFDRRCVWSIQLETGKLTWPVSAFQWALAESCTPGASRFPVQISKVTESAGNPSTGLLKTVRPINSTVGQLLSGEDDQTPTQHILCYGRC